MCARHLSIICALVTWRQRHTSPQLQRDNTPPGKPAKNDENSSCAKKNGGDLRDILVRPHHNNAALLPWDPEIRNARCLQAHIFPRQLGAEMSWRKADGKNQLPSARGF
jgi:hypothetical protein